VQVAHEGYAAGAGLVEVQREAATGGVHQVEVPLRPVARLDDEVDARRPQPFRDPPARVVVAEVGAQGEVGTERAEVERLARRGAADGLVVSTDDLGVRVRGGQDVDVHQEVPRRRAADEEARRGRGAHGAPRLTSRGRRPPTSPTPGAARC
jgi:hypothetical protein